MSVFLLAFFAGFGLAAIFLFIIFRFLFMTGLLFCFSRMFGACKTLAGHHKEAQTEQRNNPDMYAHIFQLGKFRNKIIHLQKFIHLFIIFEDCGMNICQNII
ncbi:hypothetical protein [Sphingobacterium hotanense]|nr:hypothetical protein [Sphingobacterium hotanense]